MQTCKGNCHIRILRIHIIILYFSYMLLSIRVLHIQNNYFRYLLFACSFIPLFDDVVEILSVGEVTK